VPNYEGALKPLNDEYIAIFARIYQNKYNERISEGESVNMPRWTLSRYMKKLFPYVEKANL
jgi:hypothetical protein